MDSLAILLGLTWLMFAALMVNSRKREIQTLEHALRNEKRRVDDLLNRLMTKTWAEYQQMTPLNSTSEEEHVDMSDEAEALRWAASHGQTAPVGEVFVDFDDELAGI